MARRARPMEPLTTAERAAFRDHARHLMVWGTLRLARLAIGALLLWWPLDPIVLRPEEVAIFARGRLILVGLLGAMLLGRRVVRRAPFAIALGMLIAGLGTIGWHLGATGEAGYLAFLLILPALTVPAPATLGWRSALTCVPAAAAWIAFLVAAPGVSAHPLHAGYLAYFLFCVALAWAAGAFCHGVLRAQFVERLRSEDRRRWLAKEVHDQLGQELTALRYTLAHARRCAAEDPTAVGPVIEECALLLRRTDDSLHRIVARLRPRALEAGDLASALGEVTADLGGRAGLVTRLEVVPPDLDLPPRLAELVYRIVQEGLNNVAKHARAGRVAIHVARVGDAIEVQIADDGRGPAPDLRRGSGLSEMAAALEAVGGQLELTAGAAGGLTLVARLPIPRGAR